MKANKVNRSSIGFFIVGIIILIGAFLLIHQSSNKTPRIIMNVGEVQLLQQLEENNLSRTTKTFVEFDSIAFTAYGPFTIQKNTDYYLMESFGSYICSKNFLNSSSKISHSILHNNCINIPQKN